MFSPNEYANATIIFLIAVVTAKFIEVIIEKWAKKAAAKTITKVDDLLIEKSHGPINFMILLLGAYLALNNLSFINPYMIWIDKVFYVLLVIASSVLISSIFNIIIPIWLKVQKKYDKTPRLITRMISIIIYIIAFLVIADHFNVELTPIAATLGLGGLAVGLALQSTLSNFFAGIYIISDKPIRVGDYIELVSGVKGNVLDIGWRSTRLQQFNNAVVTIPNSKLADSIIINTHMPNLAHSVVVSVGVDYSSDLEKVEKIAVKVGKQIQKKVEGAKSDWVPLVRYNGFGDSNINFGVILKAEEVLQKYVITHEYIKALKKEFDKEKVMISWPVRRILNK